MKTSHTIVVQPKYAQARYMDMAGSKNKEFQFHHCFSILQHLPKWKLRDNEPKCKKEALLTDGMDEDQLAWWNETKADIIARKKAAREARDASARGESPASGGAAGDGLVDG